MNSGDAIESLERRRNRMLLRAREVARTPDLRTGDELIEAADILERHGDQADRGLAIEARRAALFEGEFQRIAALSYLHRRRVRALVAACWLLAALAITAAVVAAVLHLSQPEPGAPQCQPTTSTSSPSSRAFAGVN